MIKKYIQLDFVGKILGLILLSLSLFSCDKDAAKSDAFGNFELDKTFVSAEANGRILWLDIEEGKHLKAGEQIGQIDTLMLHYQEAQLLTQQQLILSNIPDVDAQMNVQKQQKKNLLIQQKRMEKLFEKNAATQKQLDDVQAGIDLIDAQMAATEVKRSNIYVQAKAVDSQLETLGYQISRCRIMSPIDGEVLNQFARTGEMAVAGKPLLSMASMNDIVLKAFVSGTQLPHIKLNQKVKVLIDDNKKENTSLEGEIIWIASEAEFTPKTVQTKEERVNLVYAFKVKVNHQGELKAGMPAEVVFNP